jgi:predicted nucleic acid binding AN1-type Zn finger protein
MSKEAWTSFDEIFAKKPSCLHKNKILKCRECSGSFCAKCIQLEVHFCPKLDERTKIEKENLARKLVKVVASKIQAI